MVSINSGAGAPHAPGSGAGSGPGGPHAPGTAAAAHTAAHQAATAAHTTPHIITTTTEIRPADSHVAPPPQKKRKRASSSTKHADHPKQSANKDESASHAKRKRTSRKAKAKAKAKKTRDESAPSTELESTSDRSSVHPAEDGKTGGGAATLARDLDNFADDDDDDGGDRKSENELESSAGGTPSMSSSEITDDADALHDPTSTSAKSFTVMLKQLQKSSGQWLRMFEKHESVEMDRTALEEGDDPTNDPADVASSVYVRFGYATDSHRARPDDPFSTLQAIKHGEGRDGIPGTQREFDERRTGRHHRRGSSHGSCCSGGSSSRSSDSDMASYDDSPHSGSSSGSDSSGSSDASSASHHHHHHRHHSHRHKKRARLIPPGSLHPRFRSAPGDPGYKGTFRANMRAAMELDGTKREMMERLLRDQMMNRRLAQHYRPEMMHEAAEALKNAPSGTPEDDEQPVQLNLIQDGGPEPHVDKDEDDDQNNGGAHPLSDEDGEWKGPDGEEKDAAEEAEEKKAEESEAEEAAEDEDDDDDAESGKNTNKRKKKAIDDGGHGENVEAAILAIRGQKKLTKSAKLAAAYEAGKQMGLTRGLQELQAKQELEETKRELAKAKKKLKPLEQQARAKAQKRRAQKEARDAYRQQYRFVDTYHPQSHRYDANRGGSMHPDAPRVNIWMPPKGSSQPIRFTERPPASLTFRGAGQH
jgi:hypothetical protein